ncbi:hypothetical protein JCM8547_008465 [Rhodosporidiobolus lusitaniae]
MLTTTLLSALAVASTVQAAPFWTAAAVEKRADATNPKAERVIHDVQIHESCDAAQTAYLRNGLNEMNALVEHAHNRLLDLGEADPLSIKYFGQGASTAAAVGFYASVRWGNKAGTAEGGEVLLRCDNPDGNCDQVTAAGPWDTNRTHLASLCWDEHKVLDAPPNQWLAVDLLHRMTHIPSIAYNHVEHTASTFPDVLQLAHLNDSRTVLNSETLQLYALEAYANDVAHPPNGCSVDIDFSGSTIGQETEEHDDHDHSSSSATATASGAATATSTAAGNCHTHLDGGTPCSLVHCE